MATYSTSADLQAQASIVSGVSENEITAGSATVAALVPEPNGTTVTYDGNTNLIISGINATLNGTYAYLPNVGFTRYSTGSNVYADYNEDYAVFYNDDGTNPRAVVFVSTPGTTKWLVSEYNVSATSWTDDALVGTKTQTGAFLNVNSVSAERPESGESSSTEEIFSGPSYVTGTAEREIVLESGIDMPDDVSEVDGLAERVIVAITGGTQLKPTINNEVTGVAGRKVNTVSGIEQVQDATVAGVAEREVTGTGALVDAASVVAGVAERKIDPVNVALTSGEVGVATVGGSVERQIDGELTTVDAQVSAAAGTSERVIVVANGDLTSDEVGVATVGGVVERQIDGELTAADAQVSNVSGISERIVTFEAFDVDGDGLFGELDAGPSSITATANRSYTISADLNDADANVVNGSSERVVPMIPEVGNGDFRPTEYHLVNGEGARGSNVLSGVSQGGSSTVSGVAEVVFTASGSLTSSTSTVTGVAENKITGSGSLITVDSTVSGTSERIVVEIEADLTAEEVGVVAIAGESERIIVGSGSVSAGSSSISGVCGRAVSGSGTLEVQSSTISSSVESGSSGEGSLSSQNSTVAGVSERVITASGTLSVGDSSVTGVAERQIDASGSGDSQDTSSDVVGVAERLITATGSIVVEATLFPATGFSERTINGSGTPSAQSSVVSGEAERVVENNNIILEAATGPSSVSGASVRRSNGTGVLLSEVSIVSGASERKITGAGSIESVTDSIVAGVAENVISGTGTLVTSSSSVSGLSERTITGSGTLDTITDSVVAGAAENQIDFVSGVEQVDPSTVSGVAERTINGSGELTVNDSVVSAVAERVNPASGTLTTDASVVVATTERTINRLPDINGYPNNSGDTAFGPDDADSQVDYVSRPGSYAPRYVELSGTSNVNRDGAYDVQIAGFTVAESGLHYLITETSVYNAYSKQRAGNYDIVVYNTTRSAWYVTTVNDINDAALSGVLLNGTVAQEQITTSSSIVPYGIEFDPLNADPSEVVGLAERIVVDVSTDVQAPDNVVNGLAERAVPAGNVQIELTDDFSDVTAVANIGRITSPELVTDSSIVGGVAERTINTLSGIEQVEDSIVAGVAERTITGSGTLDTITDSIVTGVAERTITGSGTLETITDAIVAGVAERTITGSGTLDTTDVIVSGVAERTITGSGTLVDSSSTIVGVSERVITGSGVLEGLDNHIVAGVSERIITVTGINMPDDDSKVTGVAERIVGKFFGTDPKAPDNIVNGIAERTVENNNITLQVISQESTVAGIAERTVNLFSGIVPDDASKIVGIAERSITGDGELNTITDSIVNGVAEREIDDQGGDALVTTPSLVDGVAERIINLFSGIDMPDDDSKVVGVAERTIENNLITQALTTVESEVTGVAERTINLFSGINMPDDDSKVVGVAERTVETNEVRQDLRPTENNLVTGVAERIVVIESSVNVKAGDVDVITNNGTPITIDRHPIGGPIYPQYRSDLYAGDAQPTLDADRVITQQPDGLSDTYRYAPNVSDPEVSYTGFNNELLVLNGIDPNYDNVYQMLPEGYTIATHNTTDYRLTRDDDHVVYYWRNRSAGYNEYRIVAYRTNNSTWAVFETTLNPELFFYDGLIFPGAVASSLTVANSRQSKRGPYKDLRPTEYNIVTGDGDRVHENYQTPSDLVTTPSLVEAVVEITSNGLDVTPKASPSVVVGVAERTSEDGGITHPLQAGPSTVRMSADRVLPGTGTLTDTTSEVSGTTERTIVRAVDGRGPLANSPREEDANVVYHTGPNITIKGLTAFEAQYNGGYNLLGVLTPTLSGFRIVESGNDYTLVHDASYNVYYARVEADHAYASPHWHIIIFNTTRNAWYATQTPFDPRSFDDGIVISDAVLDHAHIDDFSELKPGPYATQQGDNSEVDAVVERTSNGTGTIASDHSSVGAVTEITSNLLESNVQGQNSEVDATVIRIVVSEEASLQSGSSRAFATDDRTIVSISGKSNVKGTDSTVTSVGKVSRFAFGNVSSESSNVSGIAERTSKGTGELQSQDHAVEGVSERKITAVGTLVATTAVTETVVGVAERIVVNKLPTNVHANNSIVDGVAFRKITSLEANLICDNSIVDGIVYNNIPEQDAMHTQRVFRIRKEPIRTIIVRQTPTRNAR